MAIGIARSEALAVGPSLVDPEIGDESLLRVVDVPCSESIEDPQGKGIPTVTQGAIRIALVIGVAVVEPIPRGKVFAKETPGGQFVHFGKLVVDGNSGRDHFSHDHGFGRVPRHRTLACGWVAAFLGLGQPNQFGNVLLLLVVGQQGIKPVVDDRPRSHHPARDAAGIMTVRQFALFEQLQGLLNDLASLLLIAVDQIPDGLPLNPELLPPLRELVQTLSNGFQDGILEPSRQGGYVLRTKVEPRMLLGRNRDLRSVHLFPCSFGKPKRRKQAAQEDSKRAVQA